MLQKSYLLRASAMLQLRKIKQSGLSLTDELTPYNIVPLDAPSLTNAIGLFPEVPFTISLLD